MKRIFHIKRSLYFRSRIAGLFRRFLREEAGFSLIEMVVAMAIVVIALIPLVGVFAAGTQMTVTSRNADSVRAVAQRQLDEIKGMGYEGAQNTFDPNTSSSIPCGDDEQYTCTIKSTPVKISGGEWVSTAAGGAEMYRYDVTVKDSEFNQSVAMVLSEGEDTQVIGVREDY